MIKSQLRYRGTIVSIKDVTEKYEPKQSKLNSEDIKDLLSTNNLLRDIIVLSRKKFSSTASLRTQAQSQIRGNRQTIRTTQPGYGEIRVEYAVNNWKKRNKMNALLRRYNTSMYSSTKFTKTDSFVFLANQSFIGAAKHKIVTAARTVNGKVRCIRQFYNLPAVKEKRFNIKGMQHTVQYTLTNGCFVPGQLAQMSRDLKARLVFLAKKPADNTRHIAVEIECFGPEGKNNLGYKLSEAGLGKYIELKGDGSIRPNNSSDQSYELAVLAPASKFSEVIYKTSKILFESGCKVNKTCGLHVHLDTRGDNPYRMFSNLVSAQKILYKMQPASRRENNYCEATASKDLNIEMRKGKRYLGINPMSFRRHGTIEVRLHSGTIDATKIINFVTILEKVAYNPTEIVRAASTVKGFVKQHNISSTLESYINERISKFSGVAGALQEEAS